MVEESLTSITVSWNPVPNSAIFGPPTGYKIKYAKSGSDDYVSLDVKFNQTQAIIANLERNTEYKISIAGLYMSGKLGQYSEEVEAKTKMSSKFSFRN